MVIMLRVKEKMITDGDDNDDGEHWLTYEEEEEEEEEWPEDVIPLLYDAILLNVAKNTVFWPRKSRRIKIIKIYIK